MGKPLRVVGVIVAAIATLALILVGVWIGVSRRSYPQTRGSVQVDGLTASVEIVRDEYGIPHIYAETAEDLFFAQGYVHAQDRYWQMEFWRRIGMGRLSELFGESTLSSDIFLRTMGFARFAQQEYAQLDPETRLIVDSYAEGVNAYVQSRKPAQLSLEFVLLGLQGVDVEIEPWEPFHTLTWAKIMAMDLGGNYDDELARVELIRAVGMDMTGTFAPSFRDDFPTIVLDEELGLSQSGGRPLAAWSDYLATLNTDVIGGFDPQQALAFGSGEGIGSNNWVISGDLTSTGMPLLVNDPHLGIQMPSIWYEVGLHCIEVSDECPYNVRGYSFASAPGVIIGHNDHIAWAMTNVGPDVQDLYIERINPANPNQYEVNGEWVDMDILYEEIFVQGQEEPVMLPVRITRHGPLITDMADYAARTSFNLTTGVEGAEELELTALALRWTALQPNTTFSAIWRMNRAQNFEEFREGLAYFDVPSQNFIYADVDGNIGYQMPGLIPIRANGDGSLPVPGWIDDYEWTGYIPFDELPSVYNPDKGYIATANQPVVSENYPYLLGTEFDHGYRGARVVQMLEGDTDGISIDDLKVMQGDGMNLSALEIMPYLEDLDFDNTEIAAARDWLLKWDGQMAMDSPQAALYAHVWVALVDELFSDQLPDSMEPDGGSRQQSAVYFLLSDPENVWWDNRDTPATLETRDEILASAFEKGYQATVDRLGADRGKWRWGDVHTATFENQTFGQSGIGLIESIFNRGPVATAGGNGQVNATSWSVNKPFVVSSVPSMREIIDLGDLSNSLMIHTTGQSGHAGHRHYDDFIDPWRLIQYHPTNWDRTDAEAGRSQTLTLTP
jgi:penicillin amidase